MPKATANGIELEYQATGEDGAEPVLLIMGLGAQLTRWPRRLRRATGLAWLQGHPLRQPRRGPLHQAGRRWPAGLPGHVPGAARRPHARGALPAGRHGRRHRRPARRARDRPRSHRRRLVGRDDRPAGGGGLSAADALAHLDHVEDRQPVAAGGLERGRREAERPRPRSPHRLRGLPRPRGEDGFRHRLARLSARRGRDARADPGRLSIAATIRPASSDSTPPPSPRPIAGRSLRLSGPPLS